MSEERIEVWNPLVKKTQIILPQDIEGVAWNSTLVSIQLKDGRNLNFERESTPIMKMKKFQE